MISVTPANYQLLAKLLDVGLLRQKIIAQNVANVNTPGYTRRVVKFEEKLAASVRDGRHVSPENLEPEIVVDHSGVKRPDGNNVDIDREMGELAKNALAYNTYVQILASKIAIMRMAISGR